MDSVITSLPESLPSVAEVQVPQFTPRQRNQLRASLVDIERKEFVQFVSSVLRGRCFPSPDTVEAQVMREGSIVHASNCDYRIHASGWKRVARDLPRASQIRIPHKRKPDKYGDKRISAKEAGNNARVAQLSEARLTRPICGGENPSPSTT